MPILWLKCNNIIKKTNIGGVEMGKLERKLSSSQMIILGFATVIVSLFNDHLKIRISHSYHIAIFYRICLLRNQAFLVEEGPVCTIQIRDHISIALSADLTVYSADHPVKCNCAVHL